MNKKSKFVAVPLAILLALGFSANAAVAGSVCSGMDSGKIDVTGEVQTVTLVAPEGTLIDGYCVKAGSDKQEDGGPVYVNLLQPVSTVTILHPTGKGISHYSFSTTPVVVVEPTQEPTVAPTTPAPKPTTPAPEPTTPAPVPTTPAPTVEPTKPPVEVPTPQPTTPAPTATPEPGNGCPHPWKGSGSKAICPAPEPTETPETPEPTVAPTTPAPPAPSAPVVGPVVPTAPPAPPAPPVKMGPHVPPVSQQSDTSTVLTELPYTGTQQATFLFYLSVILFGLGVLCYTLPVALTRVR